jgi:hypothetical protein
MRHGPSRLCTLKNARLHFHLRCTHLSAGQSPPAEANATAPFWPRQEQHYEHFVRSADLRGRSQPRRVTIIEFKLKFFLR